MHDVFRRLSPGIVGLLCLLGWTPLAASASEEEERPYLCKSNPTYSVDKAICSEKILSKQAYLLSWELEDSVEAANAASKLTVLEAIKQANGAWEESLPGKCPDNGVIVACLQREHVAMSNALAALMKEAGLVPSPTRALHLAAAGVASPSAVPASPPKSARAPAKAAAAKRPAEVAARPPAVASPAPASSGAAFWQIGLAIFAVLATLLVARRFIGKANRFPTEEGATEPSSLASRAPRVPVARHQRPAPRPVTAAPAPPDLPDQAGMLHDPTTASVQSALSLARACKLVAGLGAVVVFAAASWKTVTTGAKAPEAAHSAATDETTAKAESEEAARPAADDQSAREDCLAQIRAKYGAASSTSNITAGIVAQARDAAACQDTGRVPPAPKNAARLYADNTNAQYRQFAAALDSSQNRFCRGAASQIRMLAERGADDSMVIQSINRAKGMGCLDHTIPREDEIVRFRQVVTNMSGNRNFRCQARARQLAAELARVEGGFERRAFRYLVEQANRDGCY